MKNCFTVFLLAISICTRGQINIIERGSKPVSSKPYTNLYDSLSNIKELRDDSIKYHYSLNHLIGQFIYYVTPVISESNMHHRSFFSTPEIKSGSPSLPLDSCMNRYWKISNIVIRESRYVLELTDTIYGKKVYCDSRNMNRDFIVLGYYENIKKKYVGKTYIYKSRYYNDLLNNDKFNYLINFQTKKYNKEIPDNSIWRCTDIGAYNVTNQEDLVTSDDEKRCPIILIFENDSLGKYYAYIENKRGEQFNDSIEDMKEYYWVNNNGNEEERLPLFLGKFLTPAQQDYIAKREEQMKQYFALKKKRLIAKYGKYWGKLVAERQLEIGMTKQMCRDSWGEPESISRISTKYGNYEQWNYLTIYVYFENGKISAIQDK